MCGVRVLVDSDVLHSFLRTYVYNVKTVLYVIVVCIIAYMVCTYIVIDCALNA